MPNDIDRNASAQRRTSKLLAATILPLGVVYYKGYGRCTAALANTRRIHPCQMRSTALLRRSVAAPSC